MEKIQANKISNQPALIGLAVFFALLGLTQFLSYQRYLLNKGNDQREITYAANTAKERLQTALAHSFATTKTLAFIIEKYGIPKKFDDVAKPFLVSNEYIDAIQLVKKGVISEIYPLKGNEKAKGYNIFSDSVQKKQALEAIEKKELYFFGPLELQQGGLGVLVRQPVFIKNKFYGFAASLIKFPRLMKSTGIDSSANADFIFQLSGISAYTDKEEFYLPEQSSFKKNYFVTVQVPNGEWKLYVQRKHSRSIWLTVAFVSLGILLSLTGGIFAWFFARQPENLNQLVIEKTQQLRASENNYRIVLGRINDAFVALDKNWRYTFINDAALATHPQGREATLGKVIWDVHPEMEGTVFQEKYYEAMNTGKVTEAESYYPPLDTWFSVKVYPSPDGLTIFYKDITQSKKVEAELRTSIERFSLSAQATNDIIWDWDLKTNGIWWNENFYSVFNYRHEDVPLVIDFWDERLHPDDMQRVSNKIRESIANRENFWTDEYRFLDSANNTFYIYDRAYILYDKDNEPYRMIGAMINITDRKIAETALLKKTIDLNERVKELNCLYTIADIINKRGILAKTLLQECAEIIPAGYQYPEKTCVRIRLLNIEFRSQNFTETKWKQEEEIIMGDTSAGKIEVFYMAQNQELQEPPFLKEEAELLRSISRNIGIAIERKKAEHGIMIEKELSDTIINSLPGIFYLTAETGIFTRWNKNFETVSGYSAEELTTKRGTDFFDATDKQMLVYKKGLAMQEGSAELEAEFVTKSGAKIPYYFTGRRIIYDGKPALLGVGIDISERKKAENELSLMNEQLRLLSTHLQSIREEERTNIAREIHDELGQQLTGLKMDIAWIKNKSEKEFHFPLLREKTNDMIDLVNDAIASVRKIAKELRPGILDDLGLEAAIEWQANEFAERTGIKFKVETTLDGKNFSKEINTAVFRIFQESLTNIARHSEANSVVVKLFERDNSLFLEVIDNGKGISDDRKTNRTSLGLLGMNERAAHLNGKFSVEKYTEGGTIATVKIPLPA